jgi:hypothetical protein
VCTEGLPDRDYDPRCLELPHSLYTERALLGAILIDDRTLEAALRRGLTRDHFFRVEHGALWNALVELHKRGPVDVVTVATGAPAEVEAFGGLAALAALTDGVPRSSNAGAYAQEVIELSEQRTRVKFARALEHNPRLAAAAPLSQLLSASVQRSSVQVGASPLVTDLELIEAALTNPTPDLVEDLIPARSFVVVWGPYGSYKSTAVLDLGYAVQTGQPWLGRFAVSQGDVVYVAGEGGSGLYKRAVAWKLEHAVEIDRPHLRFWQGPVNLLAPMEVQRFVGHLGGLKPVLVIVDTLATCSVGAEENSSKDMGQVVGSANEIRAALGCTVLLVHHSTAKGDKERGHSSLGGAADIMVQCTGKNLALTMAWTKSKDLAESADIQVALKVQPVQHRSALVIASDRTGDAPAHTRAALKALQALVEQFGGAGATGAEWQEVASSTYGYRSNSTFFRHRKALIEADYVRTAGRVFTPTERGRSAVLTAGQHDSHEADR